MRLPLSSLLIGASLALSVSLAAWAGALHDAALAGDAETVRALVAGGADVNEQGDLGTPLHVAAFRGDAAVAGALIEAGANLEAAKEFTATRPLHEAASYGHAD